MSEFQQALIGAGVALVAGVWVYNRWQEQRYRRAAEKIFQGTQEDALIPVQAATADPEILVSAPAASVRPEERIEPHIPPAPELTVQPSADISVDTRRGDAMAAAAELPAEECVDPLLEVGIALPPRQMVATLYQSWLARQVELHKRLRWIARSAGSSEWTEVIDPASSRACDTCVTLQLADRQGAVSREDLNLFCRTAESVASAHGGLAGVPALDEIIAHANALDGICASVDIQIAIHIVGRAGQAFAGSKLRGLLEASGLQLAADGLFYLLDAQGGRLLSVCNSGAVPFDLEQMRTGTTSDVTLWLDVPRVADGGNVFDIMLATARQLAGALDGVLVDDQRNPLADNVLVGIRAKVLELQTQMAAHGIPAGGRRALRLFA